MHETIKDIATYNSLLNTMINDYLKNKLREIGNDDMVPSHAAILSIVYANGGKVQIKTICDTLLKQKTTITEMINRLVRLGYLTKEDCTVDKRITYVIATEKALDFQKKFEMISNELLDQVYQGFSEEEKIEFTRSMLKALRNLY